MKALHCIPNDLKDRGACIAGALYLLIPFGMFAVGWLRWYYAVPLLCVIAASFVLALRDMPRVSLGAARDRGALAKCAAALLIICAITALSGVGGLVYQTPDHTSRNAMFRALVEHSWPVVQDGNAFIYYLGFWLPAALVGKLFGLAAGFYFQMVWMALGLTILFQLLCAWRKKIAIWPLALFLFFSGLDVIGEGYILAQMPFDRLPFRFGLLLNLDRWSPFAMYPSLLTNLFWSFQQAVPVYVLIMLLLLQKDCRNYAFLAAPCLLCGTLAVVGLVPIALTLAFSRPAADDPIDRRWLSGKAAWTGALKDVCSVQNLLGGGLMALVMWLYLSANRSGGQTSVLGSDILNVQMWLVSLVLEFGVYVLLMASTQRENALLPTVFICLAACAWIRIGYGGDFCMRASMAALPFLALMVMDTLVKAKRAGKRVLFAALIVTLSIGALTPLSEIAHTVVHTPWGQRYEMRYGEDNRVFIGPNFSGPAEGNVFFDVLCKRTGEKG